MTFLELCQAVARESGTVPNLTEPSTVSGQSGRLSRIVHWTREAYNDIQRRREDWRWLHGEFSGNTVAATRRYDGAAMGIASRFSRWIAADENGEPTISLYKTSEGRANEGWLVHLPWPDFRRRFLIGSAATDTGKPAYVTVDPSDQLVLHRIPDADYTVSGEYYKAPQTLSADADEPEMPEKHHMAIVWQALVLMGTHDEATGQVPLWEYNLDTHIEALMLTQTPSVRLGGPLA